MHLPILAVLQTTMKEPQIRYYINGKGWQNVSMPRYYCNKSQYRYTEYTDATFGEEYVAMCLQATKYMGAGALLLP